MSNPTDMRAVAPDRRSEAQRQLNEFLSATKRQYEDLKPSLERYRERLERQIERVLKGNVPVFSVSGRVKDWDKLVPKLAEGRSLLNIGDLIGVRVITMYEDEVNQAAQQLAFLFASKPLRRNWSSVTGRKAGYAGVHVPVKLPGTAGIKRALEDIHVELQIRTHLQHVWAELSHEDFYKAPNGVPYAVQDRLFRLAAALDVLSDEIVTIREELKTVSGEVQAVVLDHFSANWRHQPIDEFTLSLYGNHRASQKLARLRKLAVQGGFRESAWPEPVRVGAETDLFVPFARLHELDSIGSLEKLLDEAFAYESQLVEVGALMRATFGGEHNLFARPLFILAIVLMLKNPARPCIAFSEPIVRAVQEVIFGPGKTGKEEGDE